MRDFSHRNEVANTAGGEGDALREAATLPPDNPFARAAYEWNNALRIAAEKMWGDHTPIERKFG